MSLSWPILGALAALIQISGCGGPCDGVQRYRDADLDGFGDPSSPVDRCDESGVISATDCDDGNPGISPAGVESCNRIDDDCNGLVDDELASPTPLFLDLDRDGFGTGSPWSGCEAPPPLYTATEAGDCDDLEPLANPLGVERCDGIDNNCDNVVDNGTSDATFWFLDNDGDGFGGNSDYYGCEPTLQQFANEITGFNAQIVSNGDDCDDLDAHRSPGAVEVCDFIDNNCDGLVDNGVQSSLIGWVDADDDGFGGEERFAACSLDVYLQVPGFGTVFVSSISGDCDDGDDAINPFEPEVCNGIDDNCNGVLDTNDPTLVLSTLSPFYPDEDNDGFGDPDGQFYHCSRPVDAVVDHSDCNDADNEVRPDADEVCNGIDDDCDDKVDNDDPSLIGGPCP